MKIAALIYRICPVLLGYQAYDSQGKARQDETPVSDDESPLEASSWEKPKDTAVESRLSNRTLRTRIALLCSRDICPRPRIAMSKEIFVGKR